jgi:hypothetical protein
MEEKPLTTEEKKLLKDEIENTTQGRQRNIKKGVIILLGSLTIVLLTSLIDRNALTQNVSRLIGAATVMSIFISAFAFYNIYYWYWTVQKEINKLAKDITTGKKLSGQLKIIGYKFISREIKLDNGLQINRYNIGGSWKIGDRLDIEYLPASIYILKCHREDVTK